MFRVPGFRKNPKYLPLYHEIFPPLWRNLFLPGFSLVAERRLACFWAEKAEEIFLLERLRLTYEGPSNSRRRDPSWDHGCSSIPVDFPRPYGLEGKSRKNCKGKQGWNFTPLLRTHSRNFYTIKLAKRLH